MQGKPQFCNSLVRTISRAATAPLAIVTVFALTVLLTQSAQAQTFMVLHNFTDGADGALPYAGLTMDRAGNLYGTAQGGGRGSGTVFKLARAGSGWTFTPLYTFQGGSDGATPLARVIFGPDGSLYGTTTGGGAGYGTVFNLRPPASACKTALCPWTETVVYRFTGGSDGANPQYGDLVFDQAGNLYGTASQGGGNCNCGVVYKLTPANGGWTESVLYTFTGGSEGGNPYAGVIFDQAGNLYGTAYADGVGNFGTAFQLTCGAGGCTQNLLHSFTNGADGGSPIGGLIFDQSGNLYGVASDGGTGGDGAVFEFSPSGDSWTFAVLYNFTSPIGGQCGPRANLVMDSVGNLYGTTYCDGTLGDGSVFELSPSNGGWTYKDLYDFTGGNDGKSPISNVLLHANGKLYGTTSVGGTHGFGVVWEVTP